MEDVTTLADLLYVMAKRRLDACRIFTTYDGGLSPFAALKVEPHGEGDLMFHFEPFEEQSFLGSLISADDFFALAEAHRLNHRDCRLLATIDGGETVLAACAASSFNGGDIHLSFMPAGAENAFADFAGKDVLLPPAQPGLAFPA